MRRDEPLHHRWIWLTYVLLFGAAVPWYLPASASRPVWPGLPLWVTVSLTATVAIALFTAYVIGRYWDEDEESSTPVQRERSESRGGEAPRH